jgi:glutathione peroxidase
MRNLTIIIGVLIMSLFQSGTASASDENIYSFSFEKLHEEGNINLADYNGKVIMLVNTASKCGFTTQYKGLQSLYDTYKDKGFVIIGIPSNDFGAQEPGSEEEIAEFCELNYGVTFPMTSKQIVSGESAHPLYKLARKELGFGTAPKWNFHKYLINKQGKFVDYFNSTTDPQADRVTKMVEKLLAESL